MPLSLYLGVLGSPALTAYVGMPRVAATEGRERMFVCGAAGAVRPARGRAAGLIGADGLDVYFDKVGGDHLEAALDVLAPFGRVAICGAIGQYNATEPQPGPDNMTNILRQKLRVQGFIVSDHAREANQEFQQVV